MSKKTKAQKKSDPFTYHYNDLRDNPLYGLCGEECCVTEGEVSEEELEAAIADIRDAIACDIVRGDKESIAMWRHMLMANIADLRELRRSRTA